ncbi:HesB/YadR/YfhF family protein [Scopulibacillus cellulosilyticus]|uniref:HesB/YadR/YfhF family protein n=1 Tax=Scopulibacillus cellulosilyticus TaxID=2665665 RepID=A0ABW2Q2G9_9BACL
MKLTVTPAAVTWFKEEWDFEEGDQIKLFVRYGGDSTIHAAFSMGIVKDEPKNIGISTIADGITFYVEQDELWYLDGRDLTLDYSQEKDEIDFQVSGK